MAQPLSPGLVGRRIIGRIGLQRPGNRVALAQPGHFRTHRFIDHKTGWPGRQNLPERGAEQAFHARKFRSGRNQHRPAAAHVIAHAFQIISRQDSPQPITIENDQVELVNLVDEQLLRRKGDQAQLIHRHPVLLVWRAQDREMHQIDRGI